MIINFDEPTHTYTDENGIVLPSVTQVMQARGLMQISPFCTGPDVGKRAHAACAELGRGHQVAIEEDILPRVEAYLKFLEESGLEITAVEERVAHPNYHYAGTVDIRGILCDFPLIIDIKSGAKRASDELQVAAYCATEESPCNGAVLYLRADGSYRLTTIPGPRLGYLKTVFLSALTEHRYAQENNIQQWGEND